MTDDGEITIDKETFLAMPLEGQLWTLFKTVQTQKEDVVCLREDIEELQDQKKINTVLSTITGGISGFLAVIGGKFFG